MTTGLLVVAHGSPRVESNREVLAVLEMVRLCDVFDHVAVAYLDCNAPTIAEAVDALVDAGASRITAVPYFLHEGRHTALDVPDQLRAAAARQPRVQFLLGRTIGAFATITHALHRRVDDVVK